MTDAERAVEQIEHRYKNVRILGNVQACGDLLAVAMKVADEKQDEQVKAALFVASAALLKVRGILGS